MRADQKDLRVRSVIFVLFFLLGMLEVIFIGTGCAPMKKELGTRFFPPPPVPPRIQFLKRVYSSQDVESHSGFEKFVGGAIQIKRFGKPYGLAVYDGLIYICDVQYGTLKVIDLINGAFENFGDDGSGKLSRPINIAIDQDGTKYVSDYERHQILVYNQLDKFVRAFGNQDLFKPAGVAVYGNKLYVADVENHEIDVLDKKTGELMTVVGEPGLNDGQFHHPTNVAVDGEGNLYVTDTTNCRVQVFDSEGIFIFTFGECGDGFGKFARAKGIAVTPKGFSFVVDSAFENVQIFTPDGEVTMFFGGFGGASVPGALWLPAGITITQDDKLLSYFDQIHHKDFNVQFLILVASQYGPPYINVYAFGEAREGSALAKGEGEILEEEKKEITPAVLPQVEKAKEQEKEELKSEGEEAIQEK